MANLTLSIDDDVLKKTRLYAVRHDTSVNAMVRDFLRGIAEHATEESVVIHPSASSGERLKAIEGLRALADKFEREQLIKTDWKWNRDDLYEERLVGRDER